MGRSTCRNWGAAFGCACALFAPRDVLAATTVSLVPEDNPVRVEGTIGDDSAFVKRFGLIADAAVSDLAFRSLDFQSETQGQGGIARQQVSLVSGKIDLLKGMPKDIEIRVTGIKHPGTYTGKIAFLVPGQDVSTTLTVPLIVIAHGVPTLTQRKGSDSVKVQRIDCTSLGCYIGGWLDPLAFQKVYPLQFDNPSLETFDISSTVVTFGDVMHESADALLTIESTVHVPVTPQVTVPVKLNPIELTPDHYSGDIQFRLPAHEAPFLKIPLEINVRSGPGLPLLVLFIGILLGRLAKFMKDHGDAQSDVLLAAYRLEARVASSPDRALLQPALEEAKMFIYDLNLDGAKSSLDAIDKRLSLLTTLRGLEQTLNAYAGAAGVAAILQNIAATRQLIATRQDPNAATQVVAIETAVKNLSNPPASAPQQAPGGPVPQTVPVAAMQMAVAQARTATAAARSVPSRPPAFDWAARLLGRIAGLSAGVRAELTLWLARPLLYLVLMVGLLLAGLEQLYVKNPVFGSSPVGDYLGLIVWAMSADVASRTISSLKSGS